MYATKILIFSVDRNDSIKSFERQSTEKGIELDVFVVVVVVIDALCHSLYLLNNNCNLQSKNTNIYINV